MQAMANVVKRIGISFGSIQGPPPLTARQARRRAGTALVEALQRQHELQAANVDVDVDMRSSR
jgi:hypothetical protein